jgi:hypothetical protein
VSHPIPLHTADRLERAFEASSRCVAARGPKGWVMRIVAYFACQYARAVIELLEGLLAEYRAGTLVFPELAGDPPTVAADSDTEERRGASRRARGPAMCRARARHRAPCDDPGDAGDPVDAPASAPERSAAIAPRRLVFAVSPAHPPSLRPERNRRPEHGPRGMAGYPCAVPRPGFAEIGGRGQRTRYRVLRCGGRGNRACPKEPPCPMQPSVRRTR